jgi:hypothetical protein
LEIVDDLIKLVLRLPKEEIINKNRFIKEFSEEEPESNEGFDKKPGTNIL